MRRDNQLTFHRHLGSIVETVDDNVTYVAHQTPRFRCHRAVQHQHTTVAFEAAGHTEQRKRMSARRMRAAVTTGAFLHIPERWMIVAVRAEGKRFTLCPVRGRNQFEVIQWTLVLAVQPHNTLHRQLVRFVARRAM